MRVRQSFVNAFMACPLNAKFQYIDNLPRSQSAKASFGTVIHDALDEYNKSGNVDAAIERFKMNWHRPERLGVAPDIWPRYTTFGGLRQRGIEILQQYHDKNRWENRVVVATEHRFLVPFGDHELTGTVDLLEVRKSGKGKQTLRCVDYKCLDPAVRVLLPDGRSKRAGDVVIGDVVVGERGGTLVPTRVLSVFDNGIRECFRVSTSSGRSVVVTPEHPFLTTNGWVKAADLEVCRSARAHDGSWVRVALGWEGTGRPVVGVREAWLLGALIGDGSLTQRTPGFTNIDPQIIARCGEIVAELGFRWTFDSRHQYRICNTGDRTKVREWRDRHGLYGNARSKQVPETVLESGQQVWLAFLAGLLDTDGTARPRNPMVIVWHSVNRELLEQCQQMIGLCGVNARVERVKAVTKEGYSFRLNISDRYGVIEMARLLLPFVVGRKRGALFEVANETHDRPLRYGFDAVTEVLRVPSRPTIGLEVGAGTHVTGGLITHNTHTRNPTRLELRANIQMTAYIYASLQPEFWLGNGPEFPGLGDRQLFEKYARYDRRAVWYSLWNNRELDAGPRDDGDFMRLYRATCEIDNAIEKQVFVPNISADTCSYCDFVDQCNLVIPISEELEKARGDDYTDTLF